MAAIVGIFSNDDDDDGGGDVLTSSSGGSALFSRVLPDLAEIGHAEKRGIQIAVAKSFVLCKPQ